MFARRRLDSRRLRYGLLATVLGLVGTLFAACGELDPAIGGLGIRAKPTPYVDVMVCGPAPPDTHFSAAKFGRGYQLIVTGRVVDKLAGQWTTPDGTRPEDPWNVNRYETFIITPYILELDRPPLADRFGLKLGTGDRIVVGTYGGSVGDDIVDHRGCEINLRVGFHVILGLSTHRYAPSLTSNVAAGSPLDFRHRTPAGPAWTVAEMLTISDDQMIQPTHPRYYREPQPLGGVIAAIERAADAAGP